MSGIKTTAVAKYVLLPGFFPRLKQLFASGFGYIAFLMAQIYFMVRLLPADHAYLNPRNVGRFGIHHVIAEAANSLVISKRNIDQLIVFVLMLTGIVLLACQIAALLFSLLFGTAMATSIFVTQNPDFDIAFMLLDQVFGVGDGTPANNFFNSCVAQNISCDPTGTAPVSPSIFPWPFHIALQNMFRFYSLGILVIGTIIFLYFIMVIVVETATTGTPFGQRFQNVWAPIRLVVAIGLLIPLGFGYNSGQYITFASAKYGSSLATNAWNLYNNTINLAMGGSASSFRGNPTGERENLIAFSKPPDAAILAQMISLVHSCAFAYYHHNNDIKKDSTSSLGAGQFEVPWPDPTADIEPYLTNPYAIRPFLVKAPADWQINMGGLAAESAVELVPATASGAGGGGGGGGTTGVGGIPTISTYDEALQFSTRGDIVIRFGRKGGYDINGDGDTTKNEEDLYKGQDGQVEPTCGEIRIPVTDKRRINDSGQHIPETSGQPSMGYLGAPMVQKMYFDIIRDLWGATGSGNEEYVDFAGRTVIKIGNTQNDQGVSPCLMGCTPVNINLPNGGCNASPPPNPDDRQCAVDLPTAKWKQNVINVLQGEINVRLVQIWNDYNTGTREFDMDSDLLNYGWGGAGIWFNKIAQVNGGFVTAILNFPAMEKYPLVMEQTAEQKDKKDSDPTGIEQFNPNASDAGGEVTLDNDGDKAVAIALHYVFEYWNKDTLNMSETDKRNEGGALENGMNLVFGTHGLFAMTDENVNIHPLAQLVTLGKGLVESSIRNIAGSTMAAALGGLSKAVDSHAGPLASAMSGLLMSTAFIGLTAGFVLYYVLPFLPFVYFYFAVASWIKTIFEAMVGVPLWALAHLRLDGDGLPGDSAANGYFLIFEIFVRPILSVAGLIAALLIFTAQVRILNFIWSLVTDNLGGHNSNPTLGIGITTATPAGCTPSATTTCPLVNANLTFKRNIVDEFFYTVLYAMIVYMMATASFKLIDKIPDNILRWMGQGVSSFGDINQDPAEGLTKYAALGGMTAGQKIAGGLKDLGGGLGSALGSAGKGNTGSDIRLKENVEHIGYERGIPIYSFSYIGEKQLYKGVMAQDIIKLAPNAVGKRDDGFMTVNYDMLGIKMQPLEDYLKEKTTNDV